MERETIYFDKLSVNIYDLVTSIARVVDMMCPAVGNHHMQVAYLAYRLGEELGLPAHKRYELIITGALHDIGAFSLKDRLDLLEFEDAKPGEHSMAGYLLLRKSKLFLPTAMLVKFHHVPWKDGKGAIQDGESVPESSHIIHLADRVAVKISKEKAVLSQVPGICEAIIQGKNDVFVPEHVDAMLRLSKRDYVWLEVTSDSIDPILRGSVLHQAKVLDVDELLNFSRMICWLIDFRSEFTATHSSGVAATAVALAKRIGFSGYECKLIAIAAYLHDLGKLAIPSEILEKKGKITDDERFTMRSHVYYTYQILQPIDMLGTINSWAALHQERLNGTGYPFGYKKEELTLGSRIIAVADVFTALTEDRPYRKGMTKKRTEDVLQSMVDNGELDKNLVNKVINNFDDMDEIRKSAQEKAVSEYDEFQAALR